MGPACNFHCKYCLQAPIKDNIADKAVSPELYAYLDHLIEVRTAEQKSIRVVFWGGEPLLYWPIIQEFVLHYENKLRYSIISNGSLLTQDKVNFLKEHRISLTLSHDGVNTTFTRNIDVLQDKKILECVNQLSPMLNAVLSAVNQDYNALFDYWDKQYPDLIGHVEMLRITWNMPKELREVDLTVYRNGLKNFFDCAIQEIKDDNWRIRAHAAFAIIYQVYKSTQNQRFHFPKCRQTERVLNVDLDGNLYVCHNSNIKIGHINDARADYLERYWQWIETRKKPECDTCEIRHYCQGGCPLDISNEACNLQKILYEEALASYKKNKNMLNKYLED